MAQIKDKQGNIYEFEPLVYKESNLTKVRLHNEGNDVEGIWIVVSDKDKKMLSQNKSGKYFVAMLANYAIHFYPYPSWGLHILCRTTGSGMPESDISWVDYANNLVWSPDVTNATD